MDTHYPHTLQRGGNVVLSTENKAELRKDVREKTQIVSAHI